MDESARGALIERSLPRLRAFVRLRMGPTLRAREGASDVVQSVCVELLRSERELEFENETLFRKWLFRAALNKIRQHARYFGAQKRAPAAESGGVDVELVATYQALDSPSQLAIRAERIELLEQAFDQLPEHYQEVITLSRFVGLSIDEIATQMERSEPSVRNLLNRALVRLSSGMDQLEQRG